MKRPAVERSPLANSLSGPPSTLLMAALFCLGSGWAMPTALAALPFPTSPPTSGCDPTMQSCAPGGETPPPLPADPATPPGGAQQCTPSPTGPTCGSDSGPASAPGNGGLNLGAGNPINLITGNKYQRETDLPALPGTLGIEIVRHYNSESRDTGQLGRQWRLSYDTALYAGPRALQIIQADGRRLIFSRDAKHPSHCQSANPADGRIDVLRDARGRETYAWGWNDGRTLAFNSAGKLDAITAADGRRLTLQYGLRGELLQVTDPQGRRLIMRYGTETDGWRGIVAIDTPVGRFDYRQTVTGSGSGNLAQVTYPGGAIQRQYHYTDTELQHRREPGKDGEEGEEGVETAYRHPNPHLLTGITVTGNGDDGKPIAQRVSTWAYDIDGRAVLSTHPDDVERVTLDYRQPGATVVTNSLGQRTTYRYRIIAGEYRLAEAVGPGCASCSQSNVRYAWNRHGQVTMETRLASTGKPIAAVGYEYDDHDRLVRVSRQSYDAHGTPGAKWELVRRMAYDGDDTRPSLIARPSVVAGREHDVRIAYNRHGQPTTVTETGWSPLDAQGRPVGANDDGATAITRSTSYRYAEIDGKSLLTEVDGPLPNGPKGSPEDSDITTIQYDQGGHYPIEIVGPGNVRTRLAERDDAKRVTRVQIEDGQRLLQTDTAYRPTGAIHRVTQTAWLLDGQGRRDPASRLMRTLALRYNATGQLTTLDLPTVIRAIAPPAHFSESVDTDGTTIHPSVRQGIGYQAGPVGSVAESMVLAVWRQPARDDDHDGAPATTPSARRWIDDFGRLVAVQYAGQGIAHADYTPGSERVASLVDAAGATTRITYDAQGRPAALSRMDATGQPAGRIVYRHAGSRLIGERRFAAAQPDRPDSSIAYRYNAFGQTTEEIQTDGAVTHTVHHNYDEAGRLTATWITSNGPAGKATAPTVHRHYQADPRQADLVEAIDAGDGWFSQAEVISGARWRSPPPVAPATADERDDASRPTRDVPAVSIGWRYGNGLQAWADYQATKVASAAWRLRGYGDGIHDYVVDSDAAGHIDAVRQGTAPLRSRAASRDWAPIASAHAAIGRAPASVGTAVMHDEARPVTALDRDIDPVQPGPTDAAGRLLRYRSRQRTFDLIWNSAGELSHVRQNDQDVATYRYDARGRRIGKTVAGHPEQTRHFVYDGAQLLAETDADGIIRKQFVYLGWRPVAWIEPAHTLFDRLRQFVLGPKLVYLHTDHRGAVTAATDERQALLWESDIDAQGNTDADDKVLPSAAVDRIEQPLRLVNQYADAETGLHYNLARYYDPRRGEFVSPDPAGLGAGYLDLYTYAGGEFLNFVDPDAWARLRYYAIDDGVRVAPNLQPNRGHWAFAIWGIAGHEDNVLVYDKGGTYLGSDSSRLYRGAGSSGTALNDFTHYYDDRAGFYSPTPFQLDMSDADAAAIIKKLTGVDLGAGQCPVTAAGLLPAIDLGVQGVLNPTVSKGQANRIVSCKANANREEIRFQRIKKAIEVHESRDRDCSTNTYHTCPAGTWNPALIPGTSAVPAASYGWVQFIFKTFMGEIQTNYSLYEAALKSLGITKAMLEEGAKQAKATGRWFDKITTEDWVADRINFSAETGLDKRQYDRMVVWKDLSSKIEEAVKRYGVYCPQKSIAADRVDPDCLRDYINTPQPHVVTERDVNGNAIDVVESKDGFNARLKLRNVMEVDAEKLGISLGGKQLNPYIRNRRNAGEARAGFEAAGIFSNPKLRDGFLAIFADKVIHDRIADAWIKKLIKEVEAQGLAKSDPITVAEEKNLAEWVFSKHNGGEGQGVQKNKKDKIDAYINAVDPIWEQIFCVDGQSNIKPPGYMKLAPLQLTGKKT